MADSDPYDLFASKNAYKELAGSAQATAGQAVFDEAKGAAGRVKEITSFGGPLMMAARTRAKQKSVGLGLQNSSTALQAGEQAVIETATPLAQTDASLYNQTQIANANNATQASIANANIRGQVGIAGLNQAEQGRQFDSGLAWDKDRTSQNFLEQRRQFDSGLAWDKDRTGQNLLEQRRQFDTQVGQQDQQFKDNLGLQKENLAAQREQFAQRLGMDQQQLNISRDQLSQQDRQFLADLDQKSAQLAQQESQFGRDQQNKVTLANLDAANRERLIQIEAGYKSEIAGNENISRAWGTMMDSINQVQNNAELDYSTKSTLIANTQRSFESFAAFWKKVTGGTTDVSDLLNFGPMAPAPAPPAPPPNIGYPGIDDPGNGSYVGPGDRGGG